MPSDEANAQLEIANQIGELADALREVAKELKKANDKPVRIPKQPGS